MKNYSIILTIMALLSLITSCTRENVRDGRVIRNAVTDIDGNHYDAVKIGDQVWMQSNLRTTRFRDGSAIREIGENDPLFYEPNYTKPTPRQAPTYDEITHGLYYNWVAMDDTRGLCPKGWHVPSAAEWDKLAMYVLNKSEYVCPDCPEDAGSDDGIYPCIAKSLASTAGWEETDEPCTPGCNPNENNATGFTAVPAGDDDWCGFGESAFFWIKGHPDGGFCTFEISYEGHAALFWNDLPGGFLNVRCVRDNKNDNN